MLLKLKQETKKTTAHGTENNQCYITPLALKKLIISLLILGGTKESSTFLLKLMEEDFYSPWLIYFGIVFQLLSVSFINLDKNCSFI
jgi:hypothetical protein